MVNGSFGSAVEASRVCSPSPPFPNDAGCKAAVICRDDDIVEALGRLSPFAEGRCLTETKPRYERRYASKLISHVGKIWAP